MNATQFYANIGTVFGYQQDYPTDGQYGYHHGVDLPWGEGTDIPSWCSGTVVRNAYNNALGNYLVIDRGTGVSSSSRYAGFCHMNGHSPLAIGTAVSIETMLGEVGETGEANGPHLHATASSSIYPGDGPWVDPLPVIRASLGGNSSAGSAGKPIAHPEGSSTMKFRLINNSDNTPLAILIPDHGDIMMIDSRTDLNEYYAAFRCHGDRSVPTASLYITKEDLRIERVQLAKRNDSLRTALK